MIVRLRTDGRPRRPYNEEDGTACTDDRAAPTHQDPTMNTLPLAPRALSALAVTAALLAAGPVAAQVAGGTTTVDVSVTESTQLAMGWSVRKALLGKTLYNETGQKVGKVEDLIIAPDRSMSYLIVGAGGFVGIGRHDVAIPVTEIRDTAGRLVMAGATRDSIGAMPTFTYATDTTKRDALVASADQDIARGRAMVVDLEKQAGRSAADAKVTLDQQIGALQADVKSAETRLSEMKQAEARQWRQFEAGVRAATARLRKSVETAAG
jgi:sporulation protein YlmC with PRC-barrel domain